MASESFTVSVKTLLGDLIRVEVKPNFTKWHYPEREEHYPVIHDLKFAMHAFDPIAYPALRSVYIPVPKEEEMNEITDETRIDANDLFLIIVKPEPMCQLIQMDEVTLPGTNASYPRSYYHWHFRLESQEECHVYLRYDEAIRQQIAFAALGPMTEFDITYRMPMHVGRGNGYRSMNHMLNGSRIFMNLRDAYVIRAILTKTMPAGFETEKGAQEEVFCDCGFVIESKKMKAHLNTKLKHKNGDAYGKSFLAMAEAYVNSL